MSIKDVLDELSTYGGYEDGERNTYENSDYETTSQIGGMYYDEFLEYLYAVN